MRRSVVVGESSDSEQSGEVLARLHLKRREMLLVTEMVVVVVVRKLMVTATKTEVQVMGMTVAMITMKRV